MKVDMCIDFTFHSKDASKMIITMSLFYLTILTEALVFLRLQRIVDMQQIQQPFHYE